jgi:hypothetical protein
MYGLLIKLMLISALAEAGITAKDLLACNSRACRNKVERASHDVLSINWKTISVWPEEAKRFR